MNPTERIGYAVAAATLTGAIWTGIVYAVDYEQSLVKQPQLQRMVNQNQISMDAMEKRALRRQIFELDLIQHQTAIQKAMRAQYQTDLDELNKQGK